MAKNSNDKIIYNKKEPHITKLHETLKKKGDKICNRITS